MFIFQYEAVVKQCEAVGLVVLYQWKAIFLQIGAQLTREEKISIATLVEIESKKGDIYLQMKTAITKIGHQEEKASAEVLMAEDDYCEDPLEMIESILFGDSRRFYRGFDNRGYGRQRNQQNSQGYNSRGYQGGRGSQEA